MWKFLQPRLFFTLVVWVYGPVLLLRELAARWNLGLAGHIMLGLVYALYNEGLVGETIFQAHVPNPSFNDYGMVLGINVPWTSVISIFHAFYAFLFPLLMVYNIYPASAGKPWIGRKWWLVISAGFIVYSSYTFLKHMNRPSVPLHYTLLIVAMSILLLLSRLFRKGFTTDERKTGAFQLCAYGIGFVIMTFIVSNLIALKHVHYFFFLLYMLLSLCITILLTQVYSIKALLVFCLSAQVGFVGCCLWVAIVSRSRPGIYNSSVFALLFIVALLVLLVKRRRYKASEAYRQQTL